MANWIYNGVELPPLPEWDKATYPYAFIDCLDGEYELYVATVRSVRDGDTYGPERAGRGRLYNPNFADGTWEGGSRSLNYSEFSSFEEYPLIWTNHDMIDLADGSVYFAASTPVGAPDEPSEPTETISIGTKYLLYRMFPPYIAEVLSHSGGSGGGSGGDMPVFEFIINCTVEGERTFQAEEGMTWAEWCESSYNYGDAYVNGNRVSCHMDDMFAYAILGASGEVRPTDRILSGEKYSASP